MRLALAAMLLLCAVPWCATPAAGQGPPDCAAVEQAWRGAEAGGNLVVFNRQGTVPSWYSGQSPVAAFRIEDYLVCRPEDTARQAEKSSILEVQSDAGFDATRLAETQTPRAVARRGAEAALAVGGSTAASSTVVNTLAATGPNAPEDGCNFGPTFDATNYFHLGFYVNSEVNCWVGGNPGATDDSHDVLDYYTSFASSTGLAGTSPDRRPMAWVQGIESNGVSIGRVSVGAEFPTDGWNWGNRAVALHELSHTMGANDQGRWPWQGTGVMNEYDAWSDRTHWDDDSIDRICSHFGKDAPCNHPGA